MDAKTGTGRKKDTKDKRASASLSASVYERLRTAIQNGEYVPGDRLLEDQIAEWLKTSRTPVREALRRLETEGFLIHESHRGMTVAQLDYQMIMELYAMRDVIEGAAAAMAARNASDLEIQMLDHLLEREKEASKTADGMAENNRRFHQAMYQCAHNRYLLKTSAIFSYPMGLLSKTAFTLPERRAAASVEHRAIVEAIRARDPERAERAARDHLRAAQIVRLQILWEQENGEV
jgi:DNA-binding GntR family transcriptional regulator